MSNPEMILHIGSHKTGTTSLQHFAKRSAGILRDYNVYYPRVSAEFGPTNAGHHQISHALGDQMSRSCTPAEAKRFAETVARDTRPGERVLISAEPFLRHTRGLAPDGGNLREARRAYVNAVRDLFKDFDVSVLVYLRRPDDFAMSFYKEAIIQRSTVDGFPAYVDDNFESFDLRDSLSAWAEVFGRDRLICRKYDGSKRGRAYLQNFFQDLGVDLSSMDDEAYEGRRLPVAGGLLEVKRRMNLIGYETSQNKFVRKALESVTEGMVDTSFFDDLFEVDAAPWPRLDEFKSIARDLDRDFLGGPESGFGDEGWRETYPIYRPKSDEAVASMVGVLDSLVRRSINDQASAFLRVGLDFKNAGNLEKAAFYLEKSIKMGPTQLRSHKAMLKVLAKLNRLDNIPPYLRLARKSLSGRDYDAYKEEYQKVLGRQPEVQTQARDLHDSWSD